MSSGGLTVKQENLARVLASGKAGSLTEAAEMAGISRQRASEVRQKATVARRVEALQNAQADRLVRLIEKSGTRFEEYLDSDDINPQVVALAYTQLRKLKSEIGEEGDATAHTPVESAVAALMMLHAIAIGARLGSRFGKARIAALLGAEMEALSLDQEQAAKVYAARTVKQLVRLARGE